MYKEDIILNVFSDLDYMWMATERGFDALKRITGRNDRQMIEFLEESEKLIKIPFANITTRELYGGYLLDRRGE